jgi:hypothetical protein
MDNDDAIRVQPVAAWEVATNEPEQLIVLRLYCLEDRDQRPEDATPGPYAALSPTSCLRLARDLLAALQEFQGGEPETQNPDSLEGSQKQNQR